MLLCQIWYIRSDNNDRTWRRPSEPQVLRLIAYYKLCSGVTWYCNQKPPNHIQRSMDKTVAHLLLEFFIWQNNYLLSLNYIGIIWAFQVWHWLSNARSLTWRYNMPETLQTYWGIMSLNEWIFRSANNVYFGLTALISSHMFVCVRWLPIYRQLHYYYKQI